MNKPGKLRVVFDAAATFQGVSLNTELLKGPDLLTSLVGVLLRFRQYSVAVSADIVKMFHQVRVREVDGPALRFLWREPCSLEPPHDYQMGVQIFGAVSSPTICAYALRQAAANAQNARLVLKQVLDSFYVDNWLASFSTIEEAEEAVQATVGALSKGGFQLAQWASSHAEVIDQLKRKNESLLDLDLNNPQTERTLGLIWDIKRDVFRVCFNIQKGGKTKRQLLRILSGIFDPLGFLVPVTFVAKTIIQEVWQNKHEWDEDLPPVILNKWNSWISSFENLPPLNINRSYNRPGAWNRVDLHVFADASERGFGAVGYLRFENDSGVVVSFVMAKSRVAPLKLVTIPRLELCAAVMATRLATLIRQELRIAINETVFHSDSVTVLQWINSSRCKFHTYVGNRIAEIQDASKPSQWRYIPGIINPADDASRGLLANELYAEHRFLQGPKFLQQHPNEWPAPPDAIRYPIEQSDPEVKNVPWVGTIITSSTEIDGLIERTSQINRLIRSTAYVFRFVKNAQTKERTMRNITPLSVEEIRHAFNFLISHAQLRAYPEEVTALRAGRNINAKSTIRKLSPYIDDYKVLRVGGRLDHAPIPLDARHPIILPSKSKFTVLVLRSVHMRLAHASAERTLHETRKMYWIIKGRSAAKSVVSKCFPCRRLSVKAASPQMSALPTCRLQVGRPAFNCTGVDYFGPIEVTIFRRKVKRWGCLFTCLTTRAVHLEMAYTLDTDSFLAAMLRFEQRRGTPAAYYSDRGTNFVGAQNELQGCLDRLDEQKIHEKLSLRQVKWVFNPPGAPHFGGAWESLVKSAKRALVRILAKQVVTDEILVTTLAIVENILNGRPLTYLTNDATEPEVLTPNHLLLGRANPNIPFDLFNDADLGLKKRWRFAEALATNFWKRWMKEFLPTMAERKKWSEKRPNVAEGDLVLVLDPNTPRSRWPLGRITKVIYGKDSIVRSAFVKVGETQLHRPAVKLFPLIENDG